jgi:hypothetical protein
MRSSDPCALVHDGVDTNGDERCRCTVHDHLVLGEGAYHCEGYEAPPYDPEADRDRTTSPSINFPRSPEEAQRALIHHARQALFEINHGSKPIFHQRTNDAGLGHTRTDQQTTYLNDAADLIGAILADRLDELEARL